MVFFLFKHNTRLTVKAGILSLCLWGLSPLNEDFEKKVEKIGEIYNNDLVGP